MKRTTGPGPNPSGLCMCGCGKATSIAKQSNKQWGHVYGEHVCFLPGHQCLHKPSSRRTQGPGPNPSGLCQCGCGKTTSLAPQSVTEKGHIKGAHVRFLPGHWTRIRPPFSGESYIVDSKTGCWVWQRGQTGPGYGGLQIRNKHWRAHRYYYEQAKGPIPEGLQLDHLCRNKLCVNPDHLEAVSSAANMRRRPVNKLTQEQAEAIREAYDAGGTTQTALAAQYEVTAGHVSRIVRRQSRT